MSSDGDDRDIVNRKEITTRLLQTAEALQRAENAVVKTDQSVALDTYARACTLRQAALIAHRTLTPRIIVVVNPDAAKWDPDLRILYVTEKTILDQPRFVPGYIADLEAVRRVYWSPPGGYSAAYILSNLPTTEVNEWTLDHHIVGPFAGDAIPFHWGGVFFFVHDIDGTTRFEQAFERVADVAPVIHAKTIPVINDKMTVVCSDLYYNRHYVFLPSPSSFAVILRTRTHMVLAVPIGVRDYQAFLRTQLRDPAIRLSQSLARVMLTARVNNTEVPIDDLLFRATSKFTILARFVNVKDVSIPLIVGQYELEATVVNEIVTDSWLPIRNAYQVDEPATDQTVDGKVYTFQLLRAGRWITLNVTRHIVARCARCGNVYRISTNQFGQCHWHTPGPGVHPLPWITPDRKPDAMTGGLAYVPSKKIVNMCCIRPEDALGCWTGKHVIDISTTKSVLPLSLSSFISRDTPQAAGIYEYVAWECSIHTSSAAIHAMHASVESHNDMVAFALEAAYNRVFGYRPAPIGLDRNNFDQAYFSNMAPFWATTTTTDVDDNSDALLKIAEAALAPNKETKAALEAVAVIGSGSGTAGVLPVRTPLIDESTAGDDINKLLGIQKRNAEIITTDLAAAERAVNDTSERLNNAGEALGLIDAALATKPITRLDDKLSAAKARIDMGQYEALVIQWEALVETLRGELEAAKAGINTTIARISSDTQTTDIAGTSSPVPSTIVSEKQQPPSSTGTPLDPVPEGGDVVVGPQLTDDEIYTRVKTAILKALQAGKDVLNSIGAVRREYNKLGDIPEQLDLTWNDGSMDKALGIGQEALRSSLDRIRQPDVALSRQELAERLDMADRFLREYGDAAALVKKRADQVAEMFRSSKEGESQERVEEVSRGLDAISVASSQSLDPATQSLIDTSTLNPSEASPLRQVLQQQSSSVSVSVTTQQSTPLGVVVAAAEAEPTPKRLGVPVYVHPQAIIPAPATVDAIVAALAPAFNTPGSFALILGAVWKDVRLYGYDWALYVGNDKRNPKPDLKPKIWAWNAILTRSVDIDAMAARCDKYVGGGDPPIYYVGIFGTAGKIQRYHIMILRKLGGQFTAYVTPTVRNEEELPPILPDDFKVTFVSFPMPLVRLLPKDRMYDLAVTAAYAPLMVHYIDTRDAPTKTVTDALQIILDSKTQSV